MSRRQPDEVIVPSGSRRGQSRDHGSPFLLDHLPPVNFELPSIQVPWMGGEYSSNSQAFFALPQQWGFDVSALKQGKFGSHGAKEVLAFLQYWLFFGLLQDVLGDQHSVDPRDWIAGYGRPDVEEKYMISPRLSTYLARIRDRFRRPRQPRPPWEYWVQVFNTTIEVAEAFDKTFAERCVAEDIWQHGPLKVTWSILMLGQILTNTLMSIYGIDHCDFQHWPDGTILHLRINRQMECPHRGNKMMALFAMDAIYILSLLSFPKSGSRYAELPQEIHETRPPSLPLYNEDPAVGRGRHRNCTVQQCLGEKIDQSLYQTAHSTDACNCGSRGPQVDQVVRILDDTEVPAFVVVGGDSQGDDTVTVEVIRASSCRYVAFSHVWADGLGNKDNNMLPMCQISRLAHLASALTGRTPQPFWIDTFGIPRELEQRKKAIAVMDSTYKLAEKVLVLDGGLLQRPSYRTTEDEIQTLDVESARGRRVGIALELLLRIVCCSWTSRLWTLPEGMLGPELHFQFSDSTAEVGDLVAQLRTWPFVGTNVVQDLISSLVRMRPKLRTQRRRGIPPFDPQMQNWPQGDAYGQFISMFQALEFRDTTWKEDEATCLGIHLGLNLSAILNRDYPERLEALFSQLSEIPADLMFTHGERTPRYPYRWAPRHLLEYKDNYVRIPAATPDRPMGIRTERGLRVEFDHFTLHTKGETVPVTMVIFFSILVPQEDGTICPIMYGMMPAALDPRNTINWRQTKTHEALVAGGETAELLYLLLGGSGIPTPGPGTGHVGLLVQKLSEEDGCIYAAPLDTVVVFETPGSSTVVKKNNDQFVHWRAEETVDGQFCIG